MHFIKKLQSQEGDEGSVISLRCELSKADASVTWKKGIQKLTQSAKYQLLQDGFIVELLIHNLTPEDADEYTCDSGDDQTKAKLSVKGICPQFTIILAGIIPYDYWFLNHYCFRRKRKKCLGQHSLSFSHSL